MQSVNLDELGDEIQRQNIFKWSHLNRPFTIHPAPLIMTILYQRKINPLPKQSLLGVHWVQSPRSVAKFLHVVMMTLSNLGYSLVQDNRSLEEAELEGELVL